MFNLPDHPEIRWAQATGYPSWNQPKTHYCEVCGKAMDDEEEIYDEKSDKYICEDCFNEEDWW